MKIVVFIFCMMTTTIHAQLIHGIVVNAKTQEPLPYVQIGVAGKDVGLISRENGEFQIDLSKVEKTDSLRFNMIGYRPESILVQKISPSNFKVELHQASKLLREVIIKDKEIIDLKKLGRTKPTNTFSGQGGKGEFGFGLEWGLKILHEEKTYHAQEVHLHLKFNTVDSILLRINFYRVKNNMPGEPLLDKAIFMMAYNNENWIDKNIEAENIVIHEDVIMTFEPIRIWYSKTGNNFMVFTRGAGYEEGHTYSRKSSFATWEIDRWPPATFYLTARIF